MALRNLHPNNNSLTISVKICIIYIIYITEFNILLTEYGTDNLNLNNQYDNSDKASIHHSSQTFQH